MSYSATMLETEQDMSTTQPIKDEIPEFEQEPKEAQIVPIKKPAVRGRPKGAKTGTGKRSKGRTIKKTEVPKVKEKTETTGPRSRHKITLKDPTKLPKMHSNVHSIKLKNVEIEELKKKDSFFQPGVCFRIAPRLDLCKECRKVSKRGKKPSMQVDCRFFQFRKLRYVEDELEVFGFLDPFVDPVEVDERIWMPSAAHRFRSLTGKNARFILTHVGMDLCSLIEREKYYYKKFKTEQPIIWKRLIDGVLEICDLCATTLFNYHFICTRCGLSLCMDCVNESKEGVFDISCSRKDCKHSLSDLSLTQIIVGDCMEKLQATLHDSCFNWEINHSCEVTKVVPNVDKVTRNLIKNHLMEIKTGKFNRELHHPTAPVEVDFSKIDMSDYEERDEFSDALDDYRRHKVPTEKLHCHPVKHTTAGKRDTVASIPRSMSQINSNMYFPDVAHRWLCDNKLLRLLDPMNPKNDAFFHEQWQRGQPVLISNLLDHLNQELWIPESFLSEFGKDYSDFVNCMTGKVVRNREISTFWEGFVCVEKRMVDQEGKPMLLKLKDWPPDSDFKNIMPSRFEDIMKNLPLNDYTNRTGDLNIVKYLPSCFIHPDLGPKGYFAYGSPFYLKAGTTNLHLDVSDACNVMCYIGFPQDQKITMDEYVEQGFKAILEADCDIANINRVLEDGEIPGAIWHIYDSCDADRIRDFLLKIAYEQGFKVAVNHDVIHDQNWYLDGELRARLYKEYGVKGYAIIQCLGDCIVLPAGTPHQVRNIYSCIKIAEDFVSPQQVSHCLNLSNQFRKLTKVRSYFNQCPLIH